MRRLERRMAMAAWAGGLLAFAVSVAVAQYKEAYQSAETLRRAGQTAEARNQFEEAMKNAATGSDQAAAQIGLGQTLAMEKNYPQSRAEYEKALALDGITTEQAAQAQFGIGTCYYSERKYPQARAEFDKVTASKEAPVLWQVQAQTYLGHCWWRENKAPEARAAYLQVLDIPGISLGAQVEARMLVVNTFFVKKRYADARAELSRLLAIMELPAVTRADAQLWLGKSFFFERKCAEAKAELARALIPESTDAIRAEAQLYIGLSDYEAQDYARARVELQKAIAMPGATEKQIHEATLRLRLRKLLPSDEKCLAVLFIGASHTMGFNIPQMVEILAASAPAGQPRIIAGEFLRGSTGIKKFWDEGDGLQTAREEVASESWDFVVFECYPFLFGMAECTTYATKFSELARAHSATPVLFDCPGLIRTAYPAACCKNHDNNVALARQLRIPVAAAGDAFFKYLGPTPTSEQRMALYDSDAVHMSRKGAYLLACSVYSAVTGLSPIGLTHTFPGFGTQGISDKDAAALQEAAWKAHMESNPDPTPAR